MQAPYIAIAWPEASDSAQGAAGEVGARLAGEGWREAARALGLAVWRRPERPAPVVVRDGGQVILIGRWRPHAGRGAMDLVASAEGQARWLCGQGWGSYVALLRDAGARRWCVFRDPSGAVEALTWSLGEVAVLASGLEHLPRGLMPRGVALNWRVIADYLARPVSQPAASALQDVAVVTPGDLQPVGQGAGAAQAIWRPKDWLPTGPQVDPTWPSRLADTVQSAVTGLCEPYGRLMSEVSGGLDSAIVHAGLSRAGLAGRVVEALHYVGDRREADEQGWARVVCERAGLPMAAVLRGDAPFDPRGDFAGQVEGARPPYAALDAVRDRDTADRLRASGAQALVTGKGGDAVFFQMPTARVLADLWRDLGPAAAWRHPRNAEVARWLRRSVWSVWREAQSGDADAEEAGVGRFAGWALRDLPDRPPHRWLEGLEEAPPGKRVQVGALAAGHVALGPSRRTQVADLVQPLLSQPVMELCLSIPSWELVRGGRDRGLAREAFSGWLPEAVVQRRSKGSLTSVYSRRAAASLDGLREHLLDGVLAGAGLLDRAAMEGALEADQLIWRGDGVHLLAAAAVESWVRHWQTWVPDAAGARRYGG